MYTVYDRIFGDFPAKNTVYTPYIYGSGQPYLYDLWWGIHFVGMPAWLYMICGGVFTWWGCLRGFI